MYNRKNIWRYVIYIYIYNTNVSEYKRIEVLRMWNH